ncbi:transcriptional regulator FtsR [Cellulomonas bogoriensis]|nr:MerR family transcriptional regulator [Cellulomonas bogoriensis]
MRISDVLTALRGDFPTVTPSKLRFLEEQGLVEPARSGAGYRQYSPADVERLRHVLRLQRDQYLPLKVIAEQLDALDHGDEIEPLVPRRALHEAQAHEAPRATISSVAAHRNVPEAFVHELVEAGILRPGPQGALDAWAGEVVDVASVLAEHGIDARHLRSFRAAADRQIDVVEQVVAPLRGQRSGAAQERAACVAAELGELCGRLHTALIRSGTAHLT